MAGDPDSRRWEMTVDIINEFEKQPGKQNASAPNVPCTLTERQKGSYSTQQNFLSN